MVCPYETCIRYNPPACSGALCPRGLGLTSAVCPMFVVGFPEVSFVSMTIEPFPPVASEELAASIDRLGLNNVF